jgi:hypothetical protein
MSQEPTPRSGGTDLPPVDQVIHDIRESSGHLRAPESSEPLPGTRGPGGPAEVSSAHMPTPAGTAVAGAPPGTGHEASGHAPGHAVVAGSAHAADAHDAHGDAHEHGEELGPIDWANWSAGAVGVALALLVTACFAMATQGLGAY